MVSKYTSGKSNITSHYFKKGDLVKINAGRHIGMPGMHVIHDSRPDITPDYVQIKKVYSNPFEDTKMYGEPYLVPCKYLISLENRWTQLEID